MVMVPDSSLAVGVASVEYKSDDWWRLPRAEDLHSYKEIDREFHLIYWQDRL